MNSPFIPDYTDTQLHLHHRPGIVAALKHGPVLPPVNDNPAWKQRDINEMLSRGLVRRHKQRSYDKAWLYELTPDGAALAATL